MLSGQSLILLQERIDLIQPLYYVHHPQTIFLLSPFSTKKISYFAGLNWVMMVVGANISQQMYCCIQQLIWLTGCIWKVGKQRVGGKTFWRFWKDHQHNKVHLHQFPMIIWENKCSSQNNNWIILIDIRSQSWDCW